MSLSSMIGDASKAVMEALLKQQAEEAASATNSTSNTTTTNTTTNQNTTSSSSNSNTTGSSGLKTGGSSAASGNVNVNASLSNVDPFISQYRDALERQRDLSMQNLDNTRRNDFRNIMAAANTAGMMYSNFPQRSKIQYDTSTYMPSQARIQSTYQTGLDKLRSNAVNLSNQLKSINEAIAELNKTNVNGTNNKNKVTTLKYNGEEYKVVGDPYKDDQGFYRWDTEDGKGVVLIDPEHASSATTK